MINNLTGQIIKGYQLREEIGAGGFGVVFRAYQPSIGREVAIKIILPEFANQTDFIRRFEAEAQLVARLENLHIVPLYDYWREPDGAYLVMRYFKGGSARDALTQDGPWDVDSVGRLLSQMAAALAVAHRNQIVHRDMKPDNVLMDENGNFFLADFGIAKDLGVGNVHQTAHIIGSPAYLSPEQIGGELVTPFTDQYSLGVCIFELLTGYHPFHGASAQAMLYKQLTEPLPELKEFRSSLPRAITDVIQRATAKQPDNRYPDVLTFAAAYRQAVGNQSGDYLSEDDTLIAPATFSSAKPTPVIIDLPPPENPYKGLRPFREADYDDFFGRAAMIEKLVSRLQKDRFVTVVGPSGSGKSSMIHAGLIPKLRQGAIQGSQDWFYMVMHPDEDPFTELESALLRIAVNPPDRLRAQLTSDKRGLLRALKRTLPDDDSEAVLVIDQFEEVFTLISDETRRLQFMKALTTAAADPRSRLRVVLTLRADFYDRPLLYPGFGELVRETTEVVLPMNRAELEQAVMGPAENMGLVIEPQLMGQIIDDVGEGGGALPLLQYALTELFERRMGRVLTLQAYQAIGGVSGALAKRAEELYVELWEPTKIAARQVFLRLINLGEGTEDTRRRAFQSELLSLNPAEVEDAVEYVLQQFGKYRLLTFDNDPQTREPTVEVAHEALIREWVRLRGWLENSRDDLRIQRRIAASATEWLNSAQDDSFLARGTQLERFREWREQTSLTLNEQERNYLDASIQVEEQREAEESARLAHEAKLEQRSRNRLQAFVILAAVAAVVSVALTSYAFVQSQNAQQNANAAATAAAVADTERAIAERNAAEAQSLALAASAQQALTIGDNDLAVTLGLESTRLDAPPAQSMRVLARSAYTPGTLRVFKGHTNFVLGAAFSPDGEMMASASADGTVRLWDLDTGETIRQFAGHTAAVNDVAISPDGAYLVSASADGTARAWDVTTGEALAMLETNGGALSATFNPEGTVVLIGDADGTTTLWRLEDRATVGRFSGHDGPVFDIAFAPRGQSFLTASGDGTVRAWNLSEGVELRRYLAINNDQRLRAVAVSPGGLTALSGGEGGVIQEWDTRFGQQLRGFFGHTADVNAIVYTPDGRQVASASDDGTIRVWDVATSEELLLLRGHDAPITTLAVGPGGRRLISGAEDGTLRLWDLRSGAETLAMFSQASQGYVSLEVAGESVFASTRNGALQMWSLDTGGMTQEFTPGSGSANFRPSAANIVNTVAVSQNRRMVAHGTRDGLMTVWHIPSNTALREIRSHDSSLTAVAFSPDNRYTISASVNSFVIRTDIASGDTVYKETILGEIIRDMQFIPGETEHILIGTNSGALLVMDALTGTIDRRLGNHDSAVLSIDVNADGTLALSGSEDGSVRLWDLTTGEQLLRLEGHNDTVTGVSLGEDGQTAVSSSTDRSIIVWDLLQGTAVQTIQAHTSDVNDVVLLPGDASAITASADGTMRMLQILSLDDLIRWTQTNRHTVELTCTQREQFRVPPYCETPTPP